MTKRVVLVRPAGPRNAGSVLRVAANFGPVELVLVAPERPSLLVHPDFVQMSHGVEGGAARFRVVATLAEALDGCSRGVGFTARAHDHRRRHDWRVLREPLREEANAGDSVTALVFGNEERGLESSDTALLRDLAWIPTSAEHGSLNLAMAVGIVLCDLFAEPGAKRRERGAKPLSSEGRAYLKANLMHALGERVAKSKSARTDIRASIERVFSRAELEDRDARAWHLMCRALGSELTPKDLGLTTHERRGRHLREQARQRGLERGGEAR
ncbi:MAG: RNA methyltransferase [Planctomycetes bacterium]|nr:RNA methyltransferase [Planctomycetota bacterium]